MIYANFLERQRRGFVMPSNLLLYPCTALFTFTRWIFGAISASDVSGTPFGG